MSIRIILIYGSKYTQFSRGHIYIIKKYLNELITKNIYLLVFIIERSMRGAFPIVESVLEAISKPQVR